MITSRDENVRPPASRQRKMKRVGRWRPVRSSNRSELHRRLGRERHNLNRGRLHQHPTIRRHTERIVLPNGFHQNLAKQEITREQRVPTRPNAGQNRLCRSAELRISFEEVNPDHRIKVATHYPGCSSLQDSRSARSQASPPPYSA